MNADSLDSLKKVFANAMVLLWVIFLVFLVCVPWGISNLAFVTPQIALIAVFYFSVYKEEYFGLLSAFFCGLVADVVLVMPLGSNALAYALLFFLSDRLRRFIAGKPFYITWIEFSILTLLVLLFQWLFVSLIYKQFISLTPIMISLALLVPCYPLVARVCYAISKIAMEEEK